MSLQVIPPAIGDWLFDLLFMSVHAPRRGQDHTVVCAEGFQFRNQFRIEPAECFTMARRLFDNGDLRDTPQALEGVLSGTNKTFRCLTQRRLAARRPRCDNPDEEDMSLATFVSGPITGAF
jgi:hypothetical protein